MSIFQGILDCCDDIVQRFEANKDVNMSRIGIASGIAAIIAACVATHKSEKVIKDMKTKVEAIAKSDLPEKEKQTQTTIETAKGVIKIGLYFTGVASLEFCSIKAFLILKDSNENLKAEKAMLISMLAAEIEKMKNYRKIIAGKIGKEAEEEAYYGVEKKQIQVTENGKLVDKTVRMISGKPANKNILLFAPWTSDLYVDMDTYGCTDDINMERIGGVMKTAGMMLNYSTSRYLTNNDIADLLHIQKSVEWQFICHVYGDVLKYKVRKVYTEYKGKNIPVYYIELENALPMTPERLKKALPYAPDYSKDISVM